ncbi:MAG: EVE domain-containing protein [Phycisphaerae bacterium]|nr:EVE domain-containing protein [Phycisphaerae bacterium]
MARWLIKGDPADYGAADLERDKSTAWTGVKNALAQRHLREMKRGDAVLFYHTGDEKAVVATAKVERAAASATDASGEEESTAVRFAFVRWLGRPVGLAEIKADPTFAEFALVRIGRLSVMPVTEPQWQRILELSGR